MKKGTDKQREKLAKALKALESLTEPEKQELAIKSNTGLSTLKWYIKGYIAKIHTAENIINKARELFPAVAA